LAIAAGVIILLLCSSPTWVRVTLRTSGGFGARGEVTLPGSNVVAAAVPLALVAAAGLVALALVRSWVRRLLAVLITAAGIGCLIVTLRALADPTSAARGSSRVKAAGELAAAHVTAVPYIAALGAVLIIVGGLLAVIYSGGWPAPARRYERVNAKASRPKDTWEALERGEDPTSG
jgi:uncharacterized membrane protein (TIGR02234 family)